MIKNTILALALVGLVFACKTDKQAAVSDASATPVAECSEADCCKSGKECSAEEKAACSSEKKASCSKVCPVTGEVSE